MDALATTAALPLAQAASQAPLIVLIAGEASGDLLGADLLAALRRLHPRARFAGIGGPRMRAQDFEAWHDISELSVMGLTEVLPHLPRLLRLRRDLTRRLLAARPALTIGIDAPDFNLGLERRLKAAGLRTVHYVSPSVLAWRESRAAKLGASADRVLCLFPMEPPIYARHGVDARFVGHPLADRFADVPDRAAARAALGLPATARVLALLPGSRRGEVALLLPDFLAAAAILCTRFPDLRIAIPAADAVLHARIDAALAASALPTTAARVLDGQAHTLLTAADVALLASGTAALEAALAQCPMVVAYRIAPLTHALVKGLGLLKSEYYSLPNILAGRNLVPERMQRDCTGPRLAEAVARLFVDPAAAAAQRAAFPALHAALRAPGSATAADAAAHAALELIGDAP
ncbi:MAG TPA: lipid-A-disaccharide synthase [Rhodanobacteraceae bacterium]|nr:lipid-A-disaccharide synthase [Rhodanobacteraceae bacterium]